MRVTAGRDRHLGHLEPGYRRGSLTPLVCLGGQVRFLAGSLLEARMSDCDKCLKCEANKNRAANLKEFWETACEHVAEACVILGATSSDPPDTWTLREQCARVVRERDEATQKLAHYVKYLGPCEACVGTGLGESDPVPYGDTVAWAPMPCDSCGGLACKAAQDARGCRDGYFATLLGARDGEPAWEAAYRVVRELRVAVSRAERAEAELISIRNAASTA